MPYEAEHHDNHGRTPANWTGAIIIMLAFVVGTIGVIMAQQVIFWIGVGLVVVGIVTWKVMLGMESGAEDAG